MIYEQNFLQASGLAQQRLPVAKILIVTVLSAVVQTTAIVPVYAEQSREQIPTCDSSYNPGSIQQRTKAGLLDSRVGPIKLVNNTDTATIISLYHPDAPKRVFKYWYVEPGKSYLLGIDNYTSDWGIQLDEGPICLIGRVATWDGHLFTTFPSRLYIADNVATADAPITKEQSVERPSPPSLETPETYETIATKQLAKGEIRSGLISLLRAADLYHASGREKEEQRVRDRIQEVRNIGNASVPDSTFKH